MLKEYLQNLPFPQAEWIRAMPGVQVCRFNLTSSSHAQLLNIPVSSSPLHFETIFCQEGRLLAELSQNRLRTAEKQEILLFSAPARLRSFRISKNLKGILVAVDGAAARESLFSVCSVLGLNPDTRLIKRKMDELEGCAVLSGISWSRAVFECLESLSGNAQEQYCVLKSIELLYLFCTEPDLFSGQEDIYLGGYNARSIVQVCAYMKAHLSEKLTIPELCHRFSVSPTSLKTGFRRIHGTTPHRWLTEQRMKQACRLLQTTHLTIQEISQSVGYDSISQFNSVFRRYYGITPGQFTKMSESKQTRPFP